MNRKLILALLLAAVLLTLLISCSGNTPSGGDNNKTDSTLPGNGTEDSSDIEPDPQPFTVYLDNEAGWDMIYCRFYGADDEYLCETELECDVYGIYYVTVPVECEKYLFTNRQGDFTPLYKAPEGDEIVVDNQTEGWIKYSDAIKNKLTLGANSLALTPILREAKCEYIPFRAEQDGIYTFTADYGLEVGIVIVEIGEGNWDNDSQDWTAFSTPLNSAFLTTGSYYACVFYDSSLADGVYEVELDFREQTVEPDPLLNKIFTDGETWFYFFLLNNPTMTVMTSEVSSCNYTYTYRIENGSIFLRLIPTDEDNEIAIKGSLLSLLSSSGKVYVTDSTLIVNNSEFSLFSGIQCE